MIRKRGLCLGLIIGVWFLGGTASGAEFFRGKTIKFVVGFSPGGGFDTYTRLIARHFGKHVPGNPTTVVQNRTGAGSLIAANYVFNQARPDGLTIGNWIGPLVLQHVLGNPAAKIDGRKFNFLGVPTPDNNVCALTKASGIKTPEDWFASERPVKIGATGPGSTTDDTPKLLRAATGLPIQIIEGYGGTARIRLAAESGEIDGGCWAWQSVKPTWAKALEAGEISIVIQETLSSHPELMNVPLAVKYAKGEEGRQLMEIADKVYSATARPYSLPPGVPQDRLKVLQKAFMDTLRDPELLAEAKKAKLEISPIDGPTVAKSFAALYDLKPETVAKLKDLLLPKK